VTDATVVVPTHDRSGWLRQTLRSVLWQEDVTLEVLVIDDGSSDDTAGAVETAGDARVRVIRHDAPQGVSASRNHGAAEARGEWLAFVDDDDVWAPRKLARQLAAAEDAGRSWAYTGCVNVDAELRLVGGRPPPPPDEVARRVFRANVVPGGGSNVVVRRATFERVGPFSLDLRNTEDWEMWIRLARHGPPAWVPEPLLGYRVHAANASLDVAVVLEGVELIERRHGIEVDRGVLHRWIGESCLRSGRRAEALKHLALAAGAGQAGNVGRDLAAIARRRIRRVGGGTDEPLASPSWTDEAEPWLRRLRG
jgi:glycosyltransferase involved in cell wall biosynthesis